MSDRSLCIMHTISLKERRHRRTYGVLLPVYDAHRTRTNIRHNCTVDSRPELGMSEYIPRHRSCDENFYDRLRLTISAVAGRDANSDQTSRMTVRFRGQILECTYRL